jgi:ribosomal protein L23
MNKVKKNKLPFFLYITEKSSDYLDEQKACTLILNKKLKKPEVKKILENFFSLKVKKIKSLNIRNTSLKKFYIYISSKTSVLKYASFYNYVENLGLCR